MEEHINSLIDQINKLWNERAKEEDHAVRDFQTTLYNELVEELNNARLDLKYRVTED